MPRRAVRKFCWKNNYRYIHIPLNFFTLTTERSETKVTIRISKVYTQLIRTRDIFLKLFL